MGNCEGGERFHYIDWMMDNGVVAESTYPWLPSPPTRDVKFHCNNAKTTPKQGLPVKECPPPLQAAPGSFADHRQSSRDCNTRAWRPWHISFMRPGHT
eukprot:gene9400-biopygen9494